MTRNIESAVRAPMQESEQSTGALPNALYGHKVQLLIDGRPVSLSSYSSEYTLNENGIEELTIILNTTKHALENPSVDAAIELAKAGFEVGISAEVRLNGGRPSGVVYLEAFDFVEDAPHESTFQARALVPIYDYTRKAGEDALLVPAQERFKIKPTDLHLLSDPIYV